MHAHQFLAAVAATLLTLPLDTWRADPAFGIEDAYKWIHQATQGAEHAAPTREGAAAWLEREWATLGDPFPGEPLIEPLGTSGVVRLHLRPYRARGGQPGPVLEAFLASAAAYRPDVEAFVREWSALGERLEKERVGNLTADAWRRLDAAMKSRGYPAVHHSEPYTRARRPAYRVLTVEQARALEQMFRDRHARGLPKR